MALTAPGPLSNAQPSTFPPLLCLTPYLTGLGDPETCCKKGLEVGVAGGRRVGEIWRDLERAE